MPLSEEAVSEIRSIMEQNIAIADEAVASAVPGVVLVVVDKDGNELFAHAAGKRGITTQEPMTLDNIFWIASCTKMVTALACMQLVEKGELKLDDAEQVEGLCPELKDIKVLKDDGSFEEKKKGITLRMLLTHTAGFGYSFFDPVIRDWSHPVGYDEFAGDIKEFLRMPLRFQPGEGWQYGIGLDWVGIVLERKTGSTLNDYIQKNICQPLGLDNVNMLPTQAMKDNLVYMHQRGHDGKLASRDHLNRRPLLASTPEENAAIFHSGGGGLFAKPREYSRILAVLLNDGVCPKTGAKLAEKSTIEEMFKNQIPHNPNYGRRSIPAAKTEFTNPIPELYPVPGNPPQGWGISFMQSNASPVTGRSEKTVHWAGLPNLYWWCDRGHGVAGIISTQVLPFFDPGVVGLWVTLEEAVYRHLKATKA